MVPLPAQGNSSTGWELRSTHEKDFDEDPGEYFEIFELIRDDLAMGVYRNKIYTFSTGGAVLRQTLAPGTIISDISSNGKIVVLLDTNLSTSKGYFYDITTHTVATMDSVEANFATIDQIVSVTFKDGYFFYGTDTGLIYNGSLYTTNDGQNLATTDFVDVNRFPLSPITSNTFVLASAGKNYLYVSTEAETRIFQNTGNASGFVFSEIPSARINQGIGETSSKMVPKHRREYRGNVFMLCAAPNAGIYKLVETNSTKVSTDVIDSLIQYFDRSNNLSTFTWAYTMDGYSFIGFTFNSDLPGNAGQLYTFVYNDTLSTALGSPRWHEESLGELSGDNAAGPITTAVSFVGSGQVYCSCSFPQGVYEIKPFREQSNTISNGTDTIYLPQYITSAFLNTGAGSIINHWIKLEANQNVSGTTPGVYISFSDDGGKNWKDIPFLEYNSSTDNDIRSRQLGYIKRDRIFRIASTDDFEYTTNTNDWINIWRRFTVGVIPVGNRPN